jgi:uroporphyrinogen decarboxylase
MFFLEPFEGKTSFPPPVWLMRQAGRYLPEYREIRKNSSSFLELVLNSDQATEITLQPIRRFNLDAAIFFSDILIVPFALGQELHFYEGKGPVLSSLNFQKPLGGLNLKRAQESLEPVLKTLSKTRKLLPEEKALIGFAGSPWTVLAYMLEGETSRDFLKAKEFALQEPKKFGELLELVTEATLDFLKNQIRSGATALQLFESWAAVVPSQFYKDWIEKPTSYLVKEIKKTFPDVPLIGFPKGLGMNILSYIKETKIDGISLDFSYPLLEATKLPCVIQGNLDPMILRIGGRVLEKGVEEIMKILKGKPFIFNLGHGVLKETPVSHVLELVNLIRNFKS